VSGARVVIDQSKWPLVYATWPSQELSDEAFEAMVMAMSALSKRGERYVVIHDARRAARPTPKQRAFAAKQQKLDAERSKRFIVCTALVVSSPLIASAVTAINWIAPPPFPQKVFSKLDDAEAWASEQLAKHRG
jgi:hypothetical protein